MATAAFLDMGSMLDSKVACNILAWMASTGPGRDWQHGQQIKGSRCLQPPPRLLLLPYRLPQTPYRRKQLRSMWVRQHSRRRRPRSRRRLRRSGGGHDHCVGLHEAFPRCHLCKKGVREWGSGFVDSGVAGTRADEPAKLKEGDLNRPRYFHRKRFLENNYV